MECSQSGIILAFENGEILLVSMQDLREIRKVKLAEDLVQASIIGGDEETLVLVSSGSPVVKRYQVLPTGFKLKSEKIIEADVKNSNLIRVDHTTREPLIISTSRKLIICKEESLEICLEKYLDLPAKKVCRFLTKYVPGVDFCQLPSGMIAVVSQKGSINYLTIWDCQYGTLQLEEQLQLLPDNDDTKEFTSRTFSICQTESESHGSILGVGAFTRPSHSKTVTLQFSLVPYYTPIMSLLTAMGRLSSKEPGFNTESFTGQLSSIVPVAPPTDTNKTSHLKTWKSRVVEWHSIDECFLEQILNPKLSWTVGTFQEKFQEWIFQKHSALRKWKAEKTFKISKAKPSLLDFPKTDFSSKAMSILIAKCFQAPESFWPRNVIEYLFYSGGVSRSMVEKGLINTLIAKNEIDLLELSFTSIIDMDETDYIAVLKFVATTNENSPVPDLFKHWWDEKLKRKAEIESESNPHAVARKLETIMSKDLPKVPESKFGVSLNEGQKLFMHYCFSAPRVASVFIKEMGSLTVAQLHTVLEWLRGIISPEYDTSLDNTNMNQKFPLWWLWYDQPNESKYRDYLDVEYQKWLTVIININFRLLTHLD
jgi:hypothetical protein